MDSTGRDAAQRPRRARDTGRRRQDVALAPWVAGAALDALAVLFPVECAGCGRNDRSLCEACRSRMTPRVALRQAPGGLPVYTALYYVDEVREVVLALKEKGRTDVARFLVPAMAAAITRALASADEGSGGTPLELVAIPTSRAAWRRRGYDPVRMLCRGSAIRPVRVLVQRGRPLRQKTLGADARALNIAGSMTARRRLDGRRFVLADDVLTTGATLAEAARAIEGAGGEVVAAAALAFTPRLDGRHVTAW